MQYQERKRYNGGTDVVVAQTEVQDPRAKLADEILLRLALNPMTPSGVTTTGHQQFRRMSPDELVADAVRMAEDAWTQYREKGWILDLPVPKLSEDEIVKTASTEESV